MVNKISLSLSIFTVLVFITFLMGCDGSENNNNSGNNVNEVEIESQHPSHVKNILFAHGYHDDFTAWDTFVQYIWGHPDYNDWAIYRTNVDPKGSIEKRASQLAEYIADDEKVPADDDSLVVVGHSMGGLDLHYIVSMGHKHSGEIENKFYKASKKIHKIYTLASPHGGDQFGGLFPIEDDEVGPFDPGGTSLGLKEMREFNDNYPYSTFSVDSRTIPLLAFRFHCGEAKISDGDGPIEPKYSDSDGTVAVKRQVLFGAPYTQSIFQARHTVKPPNPCIATLVTEPTSTDILEGILDNKQYYTDAKDIVFYEGLNCSGEENGAFSSKYKIGNVKCKSSGRCANDKTASVKIFPGVSENTVIKVYDDPDHGHKDDWTRIHIGDPKKITEPFCVNGFEHNTSDRESNHDITVTYHEMDGLNGKVSAVKIAESSKALDPVDIVFYEDFSCEGDIVADYESSKSYTDQCKEDGSICDNDKASSVRIYSKAADNNTVIHLYNDPGGDKEHGWTRFDINDDDNQFPDSRCISGFNQDLEDKHVTMDYHKHTNHCILNCGVTGHVSYITIN